MKKLTTEFNINNGKDFAKELALLKHVVEARSTIPVLMCIHVEAVPGKVVLTGTDLDTTLQTEFSAEVQTHGKFVIDLKSLSDAVKSANEFSVQVFEYAKTEKRNEYLEAEIVTPGSKIVLEAVNSDNFPVFEPLKKPSCYTFGASVINELIRKTAPCVTKEQSRFTLEAIAFQFGEVGLRCISTDGHRLGLAETRGFKAIELPEGEKPKLELLPIDAAKLLQKILDNGVTIQTDDKMFRFTSGSRVISARKNTGTFPNYEMVLPKDAAYNVEINATEILELLGNASKFVNDRTDAIRFQPYYNNFVVKASNDGGGDYTASASCNFPQNTAPGVGIKSQYLIDALKTFDKGEILAMSYKDSNAQFEIAGANTNVKYKHVIMPLRLDQNEIPVVSDNEKENYPLRDFNRDFGKVAPKVTKPNRKAQIVIEIKGILESMRELSDINDLPEIFKELFGESIDTILGKLQLVR